MVFLGKDGRPLVLYKEVKDVWKLGHRWKEITLCFVWALLWGLRRQGKRLDGMHFVVDHSHRSLLDFSAELGNQVTGLIAELLQDPSSYSTENGDLILVTSNAYFAQMFSGARKVFPGFFTRIPVLPQTHEQIAERASNPSELPPCFLHGSPKAEHKFVPSKAKLGDYEDLIDRRGFRNLTLRSVIEDRVFLEDSEGTTRLWQRTESDRTENNTSTPESSLDGLEIADEELEARGGDEALL